MRPFVTALSLVLLASPAFADSARSPVKPLDLSDVPAQCQSVSRIPHSARTIEPALTAPAGPTVPDQTVTWLGSTDTTAQDGASDPCVSRGVS